MTATARETGCERHQHQCAYTGTEPGRCPFCHKLWTVILACDCDDDGNSREHHLAVHERREAKRLKAVLARRGLKARTGH
jgi:hypothetical protein